MGIWTFSRDSTSAQRQIVSEEEKGNMNVRENARNKRRTQERAQKLSGTRDKTLFNIKIKY